MIRRSVLWTSLIVFAAAFLIPRLIADPVKKATEVTFADPVEIPGMVLEPGAYVIKVPDPVTHGDMVGFYNRDESHLYKLVRTVPRYRLEVTDRTVITYEERASGAPAAIKTWFYPGEAWGKEFVYEKAATLTAAPAEPEVIAQAAPAPVELAPEPAAEPVAEAAPAPVEAAQAAPALPEAFPGERPGAPFEELPKTATPLPLIGLIGFAALTIGAALRWLPARMR